MNFTMMNILLQIIQKEPNDFMKQKGIYFTINELNMFYDVIDAHKEKNFNKTMNLIDTIKWNFMKY